MIAALLVFIMMSNLISGIFRPNKLVYYLSILLLILIFGGVYGIADEENYLLLYNNISNNNIVSKYSLFSAPGWYFCNLLAVKIGVSFQNFRLLIGLISFLLLSKFIIRFSANPNITLVLFLIFPFLIENVQIRNFFASTIFLYSLRFLKRENRYNFVFIVFILIASSIHQIYLLFIPFVLFFKLNYRKAIYVTFSVLTLLILIIQSRLLLTLAEIYFDEFILAKISIYLYNARLGFLALWLIQTGFVLLTLNTIRSCGLDINRLGKNKTRYSSFLDIVWKLNFYTIICTFPLVMLDGNYFRIFRNVLITNFIVNSYLFLILSKKRQLYLYLIILLNLITLNLSINTPQNIKTVLKPFLEKNSILK